MKKSSKASHLDSFSPEITSKMILLLKHLQSFISLLLLFCQIKGRTIRVDHVKDYRPPKDNEDMDDITKHLREEGCAPKAPEAPSSSSSEEDEHYNIPVKKPKKGEATSFCRKPSDTRRDGF